MILLNLYIIFVFVGAAIFYRLTAVRQRSLAPLVILMFCATAPTSFTGGNSGVIWPAGVVLLLALFWRRDPLPTVAPSMGKVNGWYMALIVMYAIGILWALVYWRPEVALEKFGKTRIYGIPIQMGLTGYRIFVLFSLFLAWRLSAKRWLEWVDFHYLLRLFWKILFVISIMAIIQSVFNVNVGYSFRNFLQREARGEASTHMGVLGFSRVTQGLLMIQGTFLSVMLWAMRPTEKQKMFLSVGFCTFFLAILFSFSRNAFLTFFVFLVLYTLLQRKMSGIVSVSLLVFILVGVGAVVAGTDELLAARFGFGEGAVEESFQANSRLAGWTEIMNYLIEHPVHILTGVGFQNSLYYLQDAEGLMLEVAHQGFLQMILDAGIFGLVVLLGWIGALYFAFRKTQKLLQASLFSPEYYRPLIAMRAFILALLFSCLSQESLQPSHGSVPWLLEVTFFFGLCYSGWNTLLHQSASQPGGVPLEGTAV